MQSGRSPYQPLSICYRAIDKIAIWLWAAACLQYIVVRLQQKSACLYLMKKKLRSSFITTNSVFEKKIFFISFCFTIEINPDSVHGDFLYHFSIETFHISCAFGSLIVWFIAPSMFFDSPVQTGTSTG